MEANFSKQKGMTLLEVLVATTLMAIISVISYTGLNSLIDSKIHTDKAAETLNREILVSRQLHKDIKSIINRDIKKATGDRYPAVLGSYYSMEFSLNSHSNPLNQQRSELHRVRWELANGQLIRRTIDYLESGSQPRWQDRVYLTQINDFTISYINNAGQKLRKWPENNQFPIPKFIQINLTLKDNTSLFFNLTPNGVVK